MPIKPENRAKYPPDWPEIRLRILERDGHKCKFCSVPNYALGCRDDAGLFCHALPKGERMTKLEWPKPGDWAWCSRGDKQEIYGRILRIVLTIAHVENPDPADCRDENLTALCQRCHNHLDAAMRRANAQRTMRARRATGDLFEKEPPCSSPTTI